MNREEKNQSITLLTEKLNGSSVVYLADISALDAEKNQFAKAIMQQQRN